MGNQIADGELAVEVKGLSHWYGSQRVLNDVNLKITAGQIVALVGPSGLWKEHAAEGHPRDPSAERREGNRRRKGH